MVTIKRYSNRKMYDSNARCYVTLAEIGEMIRQGVDVEVVDHKTDIDITAAVLAQIIFEQEKNIGGLIPRRMLTKMIRSGGSTLRDIQSGAQAFLDPVQHVDEEIRRRIGILIEEGAISQEDAGRMETLLLAPGLRHPPLTEQNGDGEMVEIGELSALIQRIDILERELSELQGEHAADN